VKIEVRFRGLEASGALREHAVRRIHYQLSRFGQEVRGIVLRIGDINGPRGGLDKRCQITARGKRFSVLSLDELSGDPYSAVDSAVHRMARAVGRELERLRATGRSDTDLKRPS
jgi:ribosome-associated translation inhibitor RaiA